jgi:hypothetical protein
VGGSKVPCTVLVAGATFLSHIVSTSTSAAVPGSPPAPAETIPNCVALLSRKFKSILHPGHYRLMVAPSQQIVPTFFAFIMKVSVFFCSQITNFVKFSKILIHVATFDFVILLRAASLEGKTDDAGIAENTRSSVLTQTSEIGANGEM